MQDENVSMWHYMSANHGKLAETCKKLQKKEMRSIFAIFFASIFIASIRVDTCRGRQAPIAGGAHRKIVGRWAGIVAIMDQRISPGE
jgi:hypothetical protein